MHISTALAAAGSPPLVAAYSLQADIIFGLTAAAFSDKPVEGTAAALSAAAACVAASKAAEKLLGQTTAGDAAHAAPGSGAVAAISSSSSRRWELRAVQDIFSELSCIVSEPSFDKPQNALQVG